MIFFCCGRCSRAVFNAGQPFCRAAICRSKWITDHYHLSVRCPLLHPRRGKLIIRSFPAITAVCNGSDRIHNVLVIDRAFNIMGKLQWFNCLYKTIESVLLEKNTAQQLYIFKQELLIEYTIRSSLIGMIVVSL